MTMHSLVSILVLFCGLAELLFFSSFYFGFNAFSLYYAEIGVFRDFCPGNVSSNATCPQQLEMMSVVFNTWMLFPLISLPLAGYMTDRCGIRVCKTLVALVFFMGCTCFATTSALFPYPLYLAGCIVSFSAFAMLILNSQNATLIPNYCGFYVSLCSGLFDTSAGVFSVIDAIVRGTNIHYATLFLLYGSVGGLFILFNALFIFPRFVPREQSAMDEDNNKKDEEVEEVERMEKTMKPNDTLEDIVDKLYPNLRSILFSRFYLFHATHFVCLFTRFTVALGTSNLLLHYYMSSQATDGESAENLVRYHSKNLNYILMCGVLVAPITGLLMDSLRKLEWSRLSGQYRPPNIPMEDWYWKQQRPMGLSNLISSMTSIGYSLMLYFGFNIIMLYLSHFMLVVSRCFTFGGALATLLYAYPRRNYGMVNGINNFLACIVGLSQFAYIPLIRNQATTALTVALIVSVLSIIAPIQVLVGKHQVRSV